MNADVKKKWTDALRSGQYEQGHVNLEKDGKFCALGVLLAANGQPRVLPEPDDDDETEENYQWIYDELGSVVVHTIIDLNDMGGGLPFDEIADFIEREVWDGETSIWTSYLPTDREKNLRKKAHELLLASGLKAKENV